MTSFPTPLIDPEALNDRLDDPQLIVLDASWYMPGSGKDPEADFAAHHIAGAQRFDFDGTVADTSSPLPHMMPSSETFERHARALGITCDCRIVIYDGAGIFAAPRAWWMFRQMGHRNVAVLNGGWPAWAAMPDAPVEKGSARPRPAGDFRAAPVASRIADSARVCTAIEDPGFQIVDARAAPRFQGDAPEPRAGLRSGHMPGARNLPFDQLLSDGKYLAPPQIREVFEKAGVGANKPLIVSCGSGVTACVLALGAEMAGLDAVAVYDGSWAEWGQETRPEFRVVTGVAGAS